MTKRVLEGIKLENAHYDLRVRRAVSYFDDASPSDADECFTETNSHGWDANNNYTNESSTVSSDYIGENKENIVALSLSTSTVTMEKRNHNIVGMLHQCTTCGRGYCRKIDLDLHKLTHAFVVPKKENLIPRHNLAHLLRKCEICGLGFSRRGDLERHSENHRSIGELDARCCYGNGGSKNNAKDINRKFTSIKCQQRLENVTEEIRNLESFERKRVWIVSNKPREKETFKTSVQQDWEKSIVKPEEDVDLERGENLGQTQVKEDNPDLTSLTNQVRIKRSRGRSITRKYGSKLQQNNCIKSENENAGNGTKTLELTEYPVLKKIKSEIGRNAGIFSFSGYDHSPSLKTRSPCAPRNSFSGSKITDTKVTNDPPDIQSWKSAGLVGEAQSQCYSNSKATQKPRMSTRLMRKRRSTHKCIMCKSEPQQEGSVKGPKCCHLDPPFACNKCPRKFFSRYNLIIHDRVHSNQRPYKCNECLKHFKQLSHVLAHHRIHTNEFPYSCQNCSKRFRQLSGLLCHKKKYCRK